MESNLKGDVLHLIRNGLRESGAVLIENNIFSDNGDISFSTFYGAYTSQTSSNVTSVTMRNNQFTNNKSVGGRLLDRRHFISDNLFEDNGPGPVEIKLD